MYFLAIGDSETGAAEYIPPEYIDIPDLLEELVEYVNTTVVDALFEWLHSMEDSVERSSLIGDAILYTLNQETYLRRYLDDGHLSIDNNSAERAIKNFAVGCRNWLFAKSIRGADASAVVYSIAETALLNGLKPYVYLSYVLDELRKMGPFPKPDDLNRLLPWSNELPEEFRTKEKK